MSNVQPINVFKNDWQLTEHDTNKGRKKLNQKQTGTDPTFPVRCRVNMNLEYLAVCGANENLQQHNTYQSAHKGIYRVNKLNWIWNLSSVALHTAQTAQSERTGISVCLTSVYFAKF